MEDVIEELETEKRILITDIEMPPHPQILTLTDEETYEMKSVTKKAPVKEILRMATLIHYHNTGDLFDPNEDRNLTTINIVSYEGGSGATSLALTMARLLATEEDNNVLYLNLTKKDDYFLYGKYFAADRFPKRQFIYETFYTNERVEIENYLCVDEWGVKYFCAEADQNSFLWDCNLQIILKGIRDSKKFTHIIIDSGKGVLQRIVEDIRIRIIRKDNMLALLTEGDADFEVINFSTQHDSDAKKYHIPADTDSFNLEKDNIEISLVGKFSEAASKILKDIAEKE